LSLEVVNEKKSQNKSSRVMIKQKQQIKT